MTTIDSGVYYVSNKATGLYLDLQGGNSSNGTLVNGWSAPGPTGVTALTSHWLVTDVSTNINPNTYTFRSLRGGTLLDLSGGSSADNTRVQGWTGDGSGKNQQWTLVDGGKYPGYVMLQNVAGGTVLDLSGAVNAPGTPVIGYHANSAPNQAWMLKRIDLDSAKVLELCKNNPSIGPSCDTYNHDSTFIVLPPNFRSQIWQSLSFNNPPKQWRNQIWDCDDFAFAMKVAVARWGRDYIRVDGIAIVFGVMFGRKTNPDGVHAYNWYPTQDHTDIAFFEPQTGQATNTSNYIGYMAVF